MAADPKKTVTVVWEIPVDRLPPLARAEITSASGGKIGDIAVRLTAWAETEDEAVRKLLRTAGLVQGGLDGAVARFISDRAAEEAKR